jgi:hypothetical protein
MYVLYILRITLPKKTKAAVHLAHNERERKIAGVSGNVVLSMAGAEMTPFLIGGVGYYRVASSATGSVASNHFGFNAGAGLRIPLSGFATFIEARYNRIPENGGSTSFVPVAVGVMF